MDQVLATTVLSNLEFIWKIVLYWWWLPLAFYLRGRFLYFWLWWRNQIWKATILKQMYIEVRIPKEIVKPVKAMETVFASIHGAVYDPPDFWEKSFTANVTENFILTNLEDTYIRGALLIALHET